MRGSKAPAPVAVLSAAAALTLCVIPYTLCYQAATFTHEHRGNKERQALQADGNSSAMSAPMVKVQGDLEQDVGREYLSQNLQSHDDQFQDYFYGKLDGSQVAKSVPAAKVQGAQKLESTQDTFKPASDGYQAALPSSAKANYGVQQSQVQQSTLQQSTLQPSLEASSIKETADSAVPSTHLQFNRLSSNERLFTTDTDNHTTANRQPYHLFQSIGHLCSNVLQMATLRLDFSSWAFLNKGAKTHPQKLHNGVGPNAGRSILQQSQTANSQPKQDVSGVYGRAKELVSEPVNQFLATLAFPSVIVTNVSKFALSMLPHQEDSFQYSFAAAIQLNVAVVFFAAVGILAIITNALQFQGETLSILTSGAAGDEEEEAPSAEVATVSNDNSNPSLSVLMLFLPSMAQQFLQSFIAVIQLVFISRLVGRQVQLQLRIRDTLVDLQGGWPGVHSSLHSQKRARILKYFSAMVDRQLFFVTNLRMYHVKAQLLWFTVQQCLEYGLAQTSQWKAIAGSSSPRAVIAGYRQLCILGLLEDMYDKYGQRERREMYRVMSRALARYKPIKMFLEDKMVPYQSLKLLRRMLRVLGVRVYDFDVRYTMDCLKHIAATAHKQKRSAAQTVDTSDTIIRGLYKDIQKALDVVDRKETRYGAGRSSQYLLARKRMFAVQIWRASRTFGKKPQKLLRLPGASTSAVDFLTRLRSDWSVDDERWMHFPNATLARHGCSSIVAKFTPAGRELSKLVTRFRESDGKGWLDNKQEANDMITGAGGDAMVLADVVYWAAETGAFGGQFSEMKAAGVRAWVPRHRKSPAHYWTLQQDGDVDSSDVVAQDTIAARLLMMPVYSILQEDPVLILSGGIVRSRESCGRQPEDRAQDRQDMQAHDAWQGMATAVQGAQAAVENLLSFHDTRYTAEVQEAAETCLSFPPHSTFFPMDAWADTLSLLGVRSQRQIRKHLTRLQARLDQARKGTDSNDNVVEGEVEDDELDGSTIGLVSIADQALATKVSVESLCRVSEALRYRSSQLKAAVVLIVLKVSKVMVPEVRERVTKCLARTSGMPCTACSELLGYFDQLCAHLFHANRATCLAHQRIEACCACIDELAAVKQSTDTAALVASSAKLRYRDLLQSLASFITWLVVNSRMSLVAMLFMSGLWPRLLTENPANLRDLLDQRACRVGAQPHLAVSNWIATKLPQKPVFQAKHGKAKTAKTACVGQSAVSNNGTDHSERQANEAGASLLDCVPREAKLKWTLENHWTPYLYTWLVHAATDRQPQWTTLASVCADVSNKVNKVKPGDGLGKQSGGMAYLRSPTRYPTPHRSFNLSPQDGRELPVSDLNVGALPSYQAGGIAEGIESVETSDFSRPLASAELTDDQEAAKKPPGVLQGSAVVQAAAAGTAPIVQKPAQKRRSSLLFSIGRFKRSSTEDNSKGLLSGERKMGQTGWYTGLRGGPPWRRNPLPPEAMYDTERAAHSPPSANNRPPHKPDVMYGASRTEKHTPQPDPFTGCALTKLLDSYQMMLLELAKEQQFSRDLWQVGGPYVLLRALDNNALRAAIVASVVSGLELKDLVRDNKLDAVRKLLRWEDPADPLFALKNIWRYPCVVDDVDDEDGWY